MRIIFNGRPPSIFRDSVSMDEPVQRLARRASRLRQTVAVLALGLVVCGCAHYQVDKSLAHYEQNGGYRFT